MNSLIKNILLIVILFNIVHFNLWSQTPNSNVQNYIRDWIANNRDAPKETIVQFLDSYLPTLTSADDTYYVLVNVINSYPQEKLPYTIYLLFAQISSLKFDFETASLMYYTTFQLTNNYKYLVQVAVQEYQQGNIKKATTYLEQVLQNKVEKPAFIIAIILKSEIMLLNQPAGEVLKFLEKAQYQLDADSITSSYLYQVYRVAALANNTHVGQQIYKIMQDSFPHSIEIQTINNASISPLPLPSLLFSKVPFDKIPNGFNIDGTNTRNIPPRNTETLLSPIPTVGYQVGSFTNLENATLSLQFFNTSWKQKKMLEQVKLQAPVLSQKSADGKSYYQVIFPLSTNTEIQQKQTLFLKTEGIEGFMIHP